MKSVRWFGVAAILAASVSVHGAEVSFTSPAAGERLVAGTTVTVRWSGVPARARELELLLSVDGGRSRARIGREMEGDETSVAWTVPNLPAARAVLYVRYGDHEEERVGGASAPFAIVPAAGTPLPTLGRRDGELWIGPDARAGLDPSSFGTSDGSFVAPSPALVLWHDRGTPRAAPPGDAVEPPAGGPSAAPRAPLFPPRSHRFAAPVPIRV